MNRLNVILVFSLLITLSPSNWILSPLLMEDILLVFVSVIYLLKEKKYKDTIGVNKSLLLLLICGFLGTSISVFFLEVPLVGRDFMFVPQILKYIIIYYIASSAIKKEADIAIISKYLFVILVILSGINIFQYWNLFNVNIWLTPYYYQESPDINIEFSLLHQMQLANKNYRVVGTLGNPNYVGALMVLVLTFVVTTVLFSTKNKKYYVLLFVVFIPFILLGVLLLQSRSTLLALSLFVFSSLRYFSVVKVFRYSIFALIIFLFFSLYFEIGEQFVESGFGDRLNIKSESTQVSYDARIRDLQQPLLYVINNPMILPFGQGYSKSVLRSDSHNGFTWFMIRYGVVGLFIYISIFVKFYKNSYLGKKNEKYQYLLLGAQGLIITWVIVEFSGNAFKEVKLFSFIILFLGLYNSMFLMKFKKNIK